MWSFDISRVVAGIFIMFTFVSGNEPVSDLSIYDPKPESTINDSLQSNKNCTDDHWFGRDKGLHFAGSLISAAVISNYLHRFSGLTRNKSGNIGMTVSLSMGLGKELMDSRKQTSRFSYKDLIADLTGIICAGVLFNID